METFIEHLGLASIATKASAQTALVSSPAGWIIQARSGGHARTLMAARSKAPRVFRRMETATDYLRKLGITRFVVEMGEPIDPRTPDTRRRPDRSAALQRTFRSASEWEAWYKAEVEAAIKHADSPDAEWVSNDDAKTQWAKRREELLKSAKRTPNAQRKLA
jgi:hypothetical protein